ncbi:cytochrome P450 714C3 [Lolium perenne]|uniref:cytochrome P450 714C3 n=1 Tax=Lolium perenne TaxID=4522 RepID=UPI0021EA3C9C|nr:cytochrome P450 714C3 [Lolium perenne]
MALAAAALATSTGAVAAGTLAALALATFYFVYAAWLSPAATRRRLQKAGFDGPAPSFPLGNLPEIASTLAANTSSATPSAPAVSGVVSSDIHSAVFPYFARWRAAFGKVFVYWLGTEPFVYVADPEFLKRATGGAMGRLWGKPDVFRRDRMPMFGRGLVMAEGDEWARHRHIIAPAFSATNLNDMISLMEETTAKMLRDWDHAVAAAGRSAAVAVDVERGVVRNAAEIIARASFGIEEGGARVFEKLQAMQSMLFRSNRLVGVPLAKLLQVRKTYEAWKLGREIDALLPDIIDARRHAGHGAEKRKDLLSLLLAAGKKDGGKRVMTSRELVDECKTFFFGGHETTALAVSWTLLMLAAHPEWQQALRDELREVTGDGPLDAAALSKLTKMGWVLNEVLRLYPPSPNVQRQALHDVTLTDASSSDEGAPTTVIPKGTNMWIDVVAMHHDEELWGSDANEFRPERFAAGAQGGCGHRLGYLPFGFGGRICVGRNLTGMEYRVVLAMVLRRFELAVAPEYRHAPRIMLSLRPSDGIQLLLTPLAASTNASIKH